MATLTHQQEARPLEHGADGYPAQIANFDARMDAFNVRLDALRKADGGRLKGVVVSRGGARRFQPAVLKQPRQPPLQPEATRSSAASSIASRSPVVSESPLSTAGVQLNSYAAARRSEWPVSSKAPELVTDTRPDLWERVQEQVADTRRPSETPTLLPEACTAWEASSDRNCHQLGLDPFKVRVTEPNEMRAQALQQPVTDSPTSLQEVGSPVSPFSWADIETTSPPDCGTSGASSESVLKQQSPERQPSVDSLAISAGLASNLDVTGPSGSCSPPMSDPRLAFHLGNLMRQRQLFAQQNKTLRQSIMRKYVHEKNPKRNAGLGSSSTVSQKQAYVDNRARHNDLDFVKSAQSSADRCRLASRVRSLQREQARGTLIGSSSLSHF